MTNPDKENNTQRVIPEELLEDYRSELSDLLLTGTMGNIDDFLEKILGEPTGTTYLGEVFKLLEESAIVHIDIGLRLIAMTALFYGISDESKRGAIEDYTESFKKTLTENLLGNEAKAIKQGLDDLVNTLVETQGITLGSTSTVH